MFTHIQDIRPNHQVIFQIVRIYVRERATLHPGILFSLEANSVSYETKEAFEIL